MLSSSYIHVLYTLVKNPTMNVNKLRDHLLERGVNLSYYAISNIYEELVKKKILREDTEIDDPILPGNKRIITFAEGDYIPEKIGLIRQHVIFKGLANQEVYNRFMKACDTHPYTTFRTYVLGLGMKGYAQFDIPVGTEDLMSNFYTQLAKLLGDVDFEVINTRRTTTSNMHFNLWEEDHWNYHPHNLETAWDNLTVQQSIKYQELTVENLMHNFDKLDLMLLRELTYNAKVKAADIADFYIKDRTTISRRLNRIEKLIMGDPRLYYDRYKFDMNSSQMIIGEVDDPKIINKLHTLLEKDLFPFRAELSSDGPRFVFNMMVPPSKAPEIAHFIWKIIPNIEINSSAVTDKGSWRYTFYPENYDVKAHSWIKTEQYMVNDTIEFLKSEK